VHTTGSPCCLHQRHDHRLCVDVNIITACHAVVLLLDVRTNRLDCTNYFCISDEDYIDKIHDYIFPSTFEWIIVVLYAAVFFGGLAGNALVCIVVWKKTQMRTVTNLFIVNLSTADLLVVLVCLPPTVVGDITETWFVGRAFCKLIHYLQVAVSVFNVLQIPSNLIVVPPTVCLQHSLVNMIPSNLLAFDCSTEMMSKRLQQIVN